MIADVGLGPDGARNAAVLDGLRRRCPMSIVLGRRTTDRAGSMGIDAIVFCPGRVLSVVLRECRAARAAEAGRPQGLVDRRVRLGTSEAAARMGASGGVAAAVLLARPRRRPPPSPPLGRRSATGGGAVCVVALVRRPGSATSGVLLDRLRRRFPLPPAT